MTDDKLRECREDFEKCFRESEFNYSLKFSGNCYADSATQAYYIFWKNSHTAFAEEIIEKIEDEMLSGHHERYTAGLSRAVGIIRRLSGEKR